MLKNMSIRNKLVVSNMLMVIVPVAIITAVILLTTLSITYFSTSKMSFDPSFGSYLLYKTQFNVSSLEDKIKTPKKSDTDRLGAMDKKRIAPLRAGITKSGSGMEDRISDAVLGACANIQRDGSDIMILANDEIIYKTVEADVYEMVGAVIDICGKSLSDIKPVRHLGRQRNGRHRCLFRRGRGHCKNNCSQQKSKRNSQLRHLQRQLRHTDKGQ